MNNARKNKKQDKKNYGYAFKFYHIQDIETKVNNFEKQAKSCLLFDKISTVFSVNTLTLY